MAAVSNKVSEFYRDAKTKTLWKSIVAIIGKGYVVSCLPTYINIIEKKKDTIKRCILYHIIILIELRDILCDCLLNGSVRSSSS